MEQWNHHLQGLVSSASGSGDGVVWLLVQSLSSPSVEVSLSKTTNRKLAVRPAWPTPPSVCRAGNCEALLSCRWLGNERPFGFSGDRDADPGERQDVHQGAEAEGGGGAHQEARRGGGQGGEGQEGEGAEGERQVVRPPRPPPTLYSVLTCVCMTV